MSRKYISQFYDINKNTQAEQVLENMSEIDELKQADLDLQSNIDNEAQTRNDADAVLAEDIGELKAQVDALGNVFTLKGSVATLADLPVSDNNIGDVYYVESENVGYVWIDDNGVQRWEQLGLPIDLSEYVTSTDLAAELEDYQSKLTAGSNITILGDVISAQVPDVNQIKVLTGAAAPSSATAGTLGQLYYAANDMDLYVCDMIIITDNVPSYVWKIVGGTAKQDKLTAGTNITIDANNVISASGGGGGKLYLHRAYCGTRDLSVYFMHSKSTALTYAEFNSLLRSGSIYGNNTFFYGLGGMQSIRYMNEANSREFLGGFYSASSSSIGYHWYKLTFTTDGTSINISQTDDQGTLSDSQITFSCYGEI